MSDAQRTHSRLPLPPAQPGPAQTGPAVSQFTWSGDSQPSPSGRKAGLIAFVTMLLGALLLALSFVLPFAAAVDDHRAALNSASQETATGWFGWTNGDIADLSLFEYLRLYVSALRSGEASVAAMQAVLIIDIVIMALLVLFIVLTVLFAVLRHPVPVIVFAVLAVAAFAALCWDLKDRGALPSADYQYGIGYYLYFAAALLTLAGSVWLMVARHAVKRQTGLTAARSW